MTNEDDKTNVGRIDVGYVARLARMYLTEAEVLKFQGQLEDIVGYVRKISELDLDGIEPTSHAVPVQNVFREDVERPGLERDVVTGNAPEHSDGQFLVPKILE